MKEKRVWPAVHGDPATRCESTRPFTTGAGTRVIRCIKRTGHDGAHFAAWGGSQAWRQMEWEA